MSETAPPKDKFPLNLQVRIMADCARFLQGVLLNTHASLDPKYIWRLKGAIRLLRGDNPDRKRG